MEGSERERKIERITTAAVIRSGCLITEAKASNKKAYHAVQLDHQMRSPRWQDDEDTDRRLSETAGTHGRDAARGPG